MQLDRAGDARVAGGCGGALLQLCPGQNELILAQQ